MSKKSRRNRNRQRNKWDQFNSQQSRVENVYALNMANAVEALAENPSETVSEKQPTEASDDNVESKPKDKSEAPSLNKRVRDLPTYGQYALSICLFLNFITQTKADSLHSDWGGVLFQTNDANAINFGLQLDPSTYPNVANVTAQILNKCSNLVQVVSPTWWNDVSIDWQSLYTSCQTGIYKTQAQAYMALSQYVLDQIDDVSIPNAVWQCFDQVLEPSCQTSFFTDWAGWYKALAIFGVAVGACATMCVGYGVHQYLKGIWGQRAGYDPIRDHRPAAVNSDIEANIQSSPDGAKQSTSMSVDM